MKSTFWLLLSLGACLALLGARKGFSDCQSCSAELGLPNLATLSSDPVKLSLPYSAPPPPEKWRSLTAEERVKDAQARVLPLLPQELAKKGAQLGDPAFIRVFKETKELELWLQTGQVWKLFRTYPIAAMSGDLGPKLKEGDGQAPEGFYAFTQAKMNPASSYHLSFNIGYPNAYDQHHGRTGSFIMVHGNEVSIGCFAMTDPVIEEIYLVADAALKGGQKEVAVHVFPFRMTDERLEKAKDETTLAFWHELKPGYEAFEKIGAPPKVAVNKGVYHFESMP